MTRKHFGMDDGDLAIVIGSAAVTMTALILLLHFWPWRAPVLHSMATPMVQVFIVPSPPTPFLDACPSPPESATNDNYAPPRRAPAPHPSASNFSDSDVIDPFGTDHGF
jgi:hypothetical protein